jgi:hypothetical protein
MGGPLSPGNSLKERCRARLADLGLRLTPGALSYSVLPEVRHAFTHLKAVYRPLLVVGVGSSGAGAIPTAGPTPSEGLATEEPVWVSPEQAEHLPLPVAQRKILALARGARPTG